MKRMGRREGDSGSVLTRFEGWIDMCAGNRGG